MTFYELDGPELEHYDDGDNSEVRYAEELLHIHCLVQYDKNHILTKG